MGQEFHVVRCFSCLTFQSQQVRKDRKFACKLCGAKQSVKKDYGRGTGKDCRVHVQKLNTLRGNLELDQEKRLESQLRECEKGEESSSGVPTCSTGMYSAAAISDSHLSDDCYIDSEIGKKNNPGNVTAAPSNVCDSRNKWSSYLTSEADDSDDSIIRGPTSNSSLRVSHVINEVVDDRLDHQSPQVIQRRNQQHKNLLKGPMRSHARKTELIRQSNCHSDPYPGSLIGVTGGRSALDDRSSKSSTLNDRKYVRPGYLEKKSMRSHGEKKESLNQENSITCRIISSSSSELQSERQFHVTNDLPIITKDLNSKKIPKGTLSNTAIFGYNNRYNHKDPEYNSKRKISCTRSSDELSENLVSSCKSEPKGISKRFRNSQDGILKASFEIQKGKSSSTGNKPTFQDNLLTKEQNPVDKTRHLLTKKMTENITTIVTTPPIVKEKSFIQFRNTRGPSKLGNTLTNIVNTSNHSSANIFTQTLNDSSSFQEPSQMSDTLFQGNSNLQGTFNAAAAYSKYEAAEELEDMTFFSL